MPAKSKAQQKAAGAALSAKRGDTPKSKLQGASKQMARIDEREAARGVRLDQAQGQARARKRLRLHRQAGMVTAAFASPVHRPAAAAAASERA